MGDIIHFKKQKPGKKHKGRSLCNSGFHRWELDKTKPFDTKSGKLVNHYICSRCGAIKTKGG